MTDIEHLITTMTDSDATLQQRRDWHPDYVGEINIRIAADGRWYHDEREFKRRDLVKLFSGLLRFEDNHYFLVTPAEKLRIEVEDCPFLASLVELEDYQNQPALIFTLNTGEMVIADDAHPLVVETRGDDEQPYPRLKVRDNLYALINRSAFFDLLMAANEISIDGKHYLQISSLGNTFNLGSTDESG
jgi:uncharacterized protein